MTKPLEKLIKFEIIIDKKPFISNCGKCDVPDMVAEFKWKKLRPKMIGGSLNED